MLSSGTIHSKGSWCTRMGSLQDWFTFTKRRLETAKNYLDLVTFDKNRKLVPGDRWQVFESHTFRGAQNAIPEPRECAVADVTGDKKNDLIVLVHDRILVYPQE